MGKMIDLRRDLPRQISEDVPPLSSLYAAETFAEEVLCSERGS